MAEPPAEVLRIGLTGGIASGKTLVADMFAELGIPIIDTDKIARQVVARGHPALAEVAAEFGAEILTPEGELDRASLRRIVFQDESLRRRLETIVHPRIREMTLQASETAGGPYQVLVVPLLIESGFQQLVDRILVVDCPESIQRERLLVRDNETPEQVKRMMDAQLSRTRRLEAATDVIDNSGTLNALRRQVETLHRKYLDICGDASGRAE
jgi:dephospho-CoA kinase